MDTAAKLDLTEVGTRFDFYMELRDAFATGIVILENALKVEENLTSRENLKKLTHAVDLIESRVNYLSDFAKKTTPHSPLGQEVRAIAPNRPKMLPDVISETVRQQCEEEMRKARETGYAEDSSQKDSQAGEGTST